MPDAWLSVWAALSDASLEKRLRYYLWMVKVMPDVPQPRIGQLASEAERRGKPEIVANATKWVERSKIAPLLS